MPKTNPRPYRSHDHLHDIIDVPAGRIYVQPLRADDIHFDIAMSSHLPANLPDGAYNGSRVLDIGHGVTVRASGNVKREGDRWAVSHLHASQYPTGRDLTAAQAERARSVISTLVAEWASTHEGDIAQADDIDRSNNARTLEENIGRHQDALRILRAELRKCENGRAYATYPDLPTKR